MRLTASLSLNLHAMVRAWSSRVACSSDKKKETGQIDKTADL